MERRAGEGNRLGSGPGNRSTSGSGYCTKSSDSHGWRPEARAGAGSRSRPHATRLQPENSMAAVSRARNSPRGGGKGTKPSAKPCPWERSCPSALVQTPPPALLTQAMLFFQLDLERSSTPTCQRQERPHQRGQGQSVGVVGCPGCK